MMKKALLNLYKKLLFDVPSTTPSLKIYAIVDSLRDESVKEKIPWSGLNYLDLWHEDLWEYEQEVPVYLVELEDDNAFTEYLLENVEKDLATYFISPYSLEVLQHYYSFFTYPEIDKKGFEVYGRTEVVPKGKEWSRKVYFGFYDANVLPDFIQTLYTEEKIDEFFNGVAMWLVPDSQTEDKLYIAFRHKEGYVDDVSIDLTPLLDESEARLSFDMVGFPNIPDLASYAHEVTIDFEQMKMFEQRHKRKFIDNVFFWAKEEGYIFSNTIEENKKRASILFNEANALGLKNEEAVYRYIVYALLVDRPMHETVVHQKLTHMKEENKKPQLLNQEIWRVVSFQRRANGTTKTV